MPPLYTHRPTYATVGLDRPFMNQCVTDTQCKLITCNYVSYPFRLYVYEINISECFVAVKEDRMQNGNNYSRQGGDIHRHGSLQATLSFLNSTFPPSRREEEARLCNCPSILCGLI